MNEIMFANLLRGLVSSTMNAILIFTLARPKFSKRTMIIYTTLFIIFDLVNSAYFYSKGNYSGLAKFDYFMLFIIFAIFKPFFYDNFMQWCFTYITALNIFIVITVLSFRLCGYFPFPMYANTLIRFILYIFVIFLFQRYLRPYYLKAVENWSIIFYLVAAIFLNFGYYIFADEGLVNNMSEKFTPLLLLVILVVTAYAVIFVFLKKISSEYDLREENMVSSMQQKHLKNELLLYNDFINDAKQNRHDLRHHNTILYEYLSSNDIDGAKNYLRQYNNSISEISLYNYCENLTANILLRFYRRQSEKNSVRFEVFAQIPEALPISDPELGTLLANMLENATEACIKCDGGERYIVFKAKTNHNRLEIELLNSVCVKVNFQDELPLTTKNSGTGTKSMRNIVKKHGGMLRFLQNENTFITQVILSL